MPAPRPGEFIGLDMPEGQRPVLNDKLFQLWNDCPQFREANFQQYKATGIPTKLMLAVHYQFQQIPAKFLNKIQRLNKIALQRAVEIENAAKKKEGKSGLCLESLFARS